MLAVLSRAHVRRLQRPATLLLQPVHVATGRGISPRGDLLLRMAYVTLGFAPITALALDSLGWAPLPTTTLCVILPLLGGCLFLSCRFPAYGWLALRGLVIGLVATLLYDGMRVPFILSGVWSDFIPKISAALLHTAHPNWLIGYTWRYIGDGGFMALAFTIGYDGLKPRVEVRMAAVGFGLAIWICLLLTLLLTPHSQETLFPLTPITLCLSLLGHLIYGATIGVLLHRWKGRSDSQALERQQKTQQRPRMSAETATREISVICCGQCAALLPEWAHFCGHCGVSLVYAGSFSHQAILSPDTSRRIILFSEPDGESSQHTFPH